ncbi:hypothetical protein PPNSA23_40040 [Phyllobacterium phragmitis]|uniref:Uncharacterized protein n=1 Tax=Phyllobacterium phragmitis TaxID=2670329 RepID=A0ABQ0H555_9HYPH
MAIVIAMVAANPAKAPETIRCTVTFRALLQTDAEGTRDGRFTKSIIPLEAGCHF